MSTLRRAIGVFLVVAVAGLALWSPAYQRIETSRATTRSMNAAAAAAVAQQTAGSERVEAVLTGALRDAPAAPLADPRLNREINPRGGMGLVKDMNPDMGPDALLAQQEAVAPAAADAFTTPQLNFNGQTFSNVSPPDTVGDIGPNHYVQMINGSSGARITVYNKSTGAVLAGPALLNSLAPASHACRSFAAGDPVAVYDQLAGRWVLSEFTDPGSGNYMCIYVSTSSDPTGSYYFYAVQAPNFPDYPKYAVWNDAYYITTNESSASGPTPAVYALERSKMLVGQSAGVQRRTADALSGFGFQALTPVDVDGATAPPSGSPGLFMRHRDTEVHGPSGQPGSDLLEVWAFTVNWSTPASSTFSKIANVSVAEFDSTLCGLSTLQCIPQPGTTMRIDGIREVIMWRVAYRNFGSRQVMVGNFAVDVGSDRAGIRWFELRNTGGGWSLFQEGTYAPGNLNRWMGSIAMDKSGNIALGYNVANSSTYPGLRYTGRLAGDSAGTMTQSETTLVNGTGSNGDPRYGDYSSMNVDPTDDCTFWFTGEWNASSVWSTRIAKFKFDQCGQVTPPGTPRAWLPLLYRSNPPTTGAVMGTVTRSGNNQAISGAQVCVLSSNQCATTNAAGAYMISNVAAGSQTVRASASGYTSVQQAVTVFAGGTVTANFSLTPGTVTRTITQSQSQSITNDNSVACLNSAGYHTDNAYLRRFRLSDYGISGAFNVSNVEFGVEYAQAGSGSSQPMRLRIYRLSNPSGSMTYGNMSLIATVNFNLPNQSLSRYSVPITANVPAGSVLVAEVFSPSGQAASNRFFIGSNSGGETAPSYLAAAGCGLSEPTTTGSIGYGTMHVVINVTGTATVLLASPTAIEPVESITVTLGEAVEGYRLRTYGE
ncbi:MAG: carboxypeptidase regulatory-like domain-containing protein [Caldilineales bacterium]